MAGQVLWGWRPEGVLDPRVSWKDGAAYDAQATKLARMFRENFKKFGDNPIAKAAEAAGPA